LKPSQSKEHHFTHGIKLPKELHCLKISESLIKNLVKSDGYDEKSNNNTKSKTITRKDTLDQFDKDLINTVVYNLFQKNECVTLKKLKNFLEKNHEIVLSKYKLWTTLHGLGFKYKKLDKNRKGLVERKDIVNQRIYYYYYYYIYTFLEQLRKSVTKATPPFI